MRNKLEKIIAFIVATSFAIASGNASSQTPQTRRLITITYQDLTGTQPQSSSAWVSHSDGVHLWVADQKANFALKRMAEEGSPELIVADALFDPMHRFADQAIGLITFPGMTQTVSLHIDEAHPMISGVWMLGATNDGFAGVDAVTLFGCQSLLRWTCMHSMQVHVKIANVNGIPWL